MNPITYHQTWTRCLADRRSNAMEVVTGAFGYVGRYITAHLLKAGREVKTITTHVAMSNPFAAQVSAFA